MSLEHFWVNSATNPDTFVQQMEDFISSRGPSADGIYGSLSTGVDFHIWVRGDGRTDLSYVANNDPVNVPPDWDDFILEALNGEVDVFRVPIGFNKNNPDHPSDYSLWYVEVATKP